MAVNTFQRIVVNTSINGKKTHFIARKHCSRIFYMGILEDYSLLF